MNSYPSFNVQTLRPPPMEPDDYGDRDGSHSWNQNQRNDEEEDVVERAENEDYGREETTGMLNQDQESSYDNNSNDQDYMDDGMGYIKMEEVQQVQHRENIVIDNDSNVQIEENSQEETFMDLENLYPIL